MNTKVTSQITSPPSELQSRPVYYTLQPVAGAQWNLVIAEGEGMLSVFRMLDEAPPGFSARTHVVYLSEKNFDDDAYLEQLENYGAVSVHHTTGRKEVLARLDRLLQRAKMGTRLYAVGSETFLGLVIREALNHGIHHSSVITELRGSLARRVQCVHCKFIAEGITTTIYDCPRCHETLAVRDHYSRRLAAFQGVSATVETPGQQPTPEEVYL